MKVGKQKMANLEIEKLGNRILQIQQECNDIKIQQKLQTIYEQLYGRNALESVNLLERLKSRLSMLNPNRRKAIEDARIKEAISQIEQIIKEEIITKDVFKHPILKDAESDLGNAINRFLDLNLGVQFNKNSCKRYEINLTPEIRQVAYSVALNRIATLYLQTEKSSVEGIVELVRTAYNNERENIKKNIQQLEIEPYYGNREFMIGRIQLIMQCIERMIHHPKFQTRDDIKQDLLDVQELYMMCQGITLETNSVMEQKKNYNSLEALYLQAISIEEKLSKEVEEVWQEKAKQAQQNGEIAEWVHAFTSGEFEPEDMHKACVTYVTDKTVAIPYGEYGYVYETQMKNMLQISPEDAGSWVISKNEFIERDLPSSWQFTEPFDTAGNRIWYENPPVVSKLFLPDDVEQATIDATIKYNGEMLNYDKVVPYNEGIVTNMMPKAVWVKTLGDDDNNENVKKAKALSERLGIPLRVYDFTNLRDKLGLPKLTSKEMEHNSRSR